MTSSPNSPFAISSDPRSSARERALHVLYEAHAKTSSGQAVVEAQVLPVDELVVSIISGIDEHLSALDAFIEQHLIGWTLARMPIVDLLILRIATFELVHRWSVPRAVVINEAVELAKRFSTEESGRFINGVLSAITKDVRANQQ
jgi:N utilization substance protein B